MNLLLTLGLSVALAVAVVRHELKRLFLHKPAFPERAIPILQELVTSSRIVPAPTLAETRLELDVWDIEEAALEAGLSTDEAFDFGRTLVEIRIGLA